MNAFPDLQEKIALFADKTNSFMNKGSQSVVGF